MLVNNLECGLYQDGEVWIQTTPKHLEATEGKIYLTVVELNRLLGLANPGPTTGVEKLEDAAKRVEALRSELLFDGAFDDGVMEMMAKFELLQGLALLDAAARSLQKAAILQTRALAQSPFRP